jgi:hypothetical protein
MERFTEGCRRRPPLYGPSAELNYGRRDKRAVCFLGYDRIHLHTKSSIDMRFAGVILPDNAELQDTLGYLYDL